ncbi:MAG TPA: outer membrane beta-barrel protein [Pseudolabrys sp.]|nr:outer membrane beta-barrel protein [Pseudolabrys sp.]
MPRFRSPCSVAPRGAGLLFAACCGLGIGFGCAGAQAQLAMPQNADPFAAASPSANGKAPAANTFRRSNPATDNGQPDTFRPLQPIQPMQPMQPPASGQGVTGFNASNAPAAPATAQASAYGANAYGGDSYGSPAGVEPDGATITPQPVSPYQQPIPPLAGDQAQVGAPGQPPVPDTGPIRRPVKKRRAHPDEPTDPFAPTGVRAGSFDLYPAVELRAGYDSNPNEAGSAKGAAVYTVAPEIKVQSDWSRHALNAELRGSYTGYSPDRQPTLSRPYINGRVDGRIDASSDTKINLGGRVLVSTDNPGSPNLQAGLAKLPVFVTYGGSAGVTQNFNRFELRLTGDAQRTAYQDSQLTDGTTASNQDRNYNQFGGVLRGSYEMTPGVKPFIEIGVDTRQHDVATDSYGYQRNSSGITGKIGTTFELTHLLTGEVGLGYTQRKYDDPRFDTIGGFVGDASLIWTPDALNTFKLTAASTVGESAVAGVAGVFYRDVALQYDHAFRRWLIGSAKVGFGLDSYKGGSSSSSTTTISAICGCVITVPGETTPDREDKRYTAGLGLTYKFSREIWLNGAFQQTWVRSNVAGYDYDDSLFLLGVRLQR